MRGDEVVKETEGECVRCHMRGILGDGMCQACWDSTVSDRALLNSEQIQQMLDVWGLRAGVDLTPHAGTERCATCNTWTGGALWCSSCRPG